MGKRNISAKSDMITQSKPAFLNRQKDIPAPA